MQYDVFLRLQKFVLLLIKNWVSAPGGRGSPPRQAVGVRAVGGPPAHAAEAANDRKYIKRIVRDFENIPIVTIYPLT